MNIALRDILLVSGLCGTVAAQASITAPPLDVVVTKEPGAIVAFRGKTDATGNFATRDLAPGAYIVQFSSQKAAALKHSQLSIDVGGGRNLMRATAVPGEKFAGAGVAMKVEVTQLSRLSGQVANSVQTASLSQPGATSAKANVKHMNGKRYVWVPGGIETRIGGKWVEEGSEAARLSPAARSRVDGETSRGDREMRSSSLEPRGNGGGFNLEIMDHTGSLHPAPLRALAMGDGK